MDIVEKLRKYKRECSGSAEYCHRAADEIERLRFELHDAGKQINSDILDALRYAEEMRTALRIIHTQAGIPDALDANHVRELTAKVLRIKGH